MNILNYLFVNAYDKISESERNSMCQSLGKKG